MPRKMMGKRLTEKEHRQWKHVYKSTGSGAAATAVVKRSVRKRTRRTDKRK